MSTSWLDVSDTAPRISYTATAGQTLFTVPFVFFEDADLRVYQNEVLLTLDTDYTVAGEEDEDGGTVTLLTGATLADAISIVRDIPIEQTTHIALSGPLDIPAINIQLSRIIAIAQELASRILRAVHLNASDPTVDMEVPSVTSRKGKMWAWASGDGSLTATTHTYEEFDSIVTGALATDGGFGNINIIGTQAGLKALVPVAGAIVYVQGRTADGDGGQGIFVWKTGNFTAQAAIDTYEGIYVKAASVATTVGCWVFQFDGINYYSRRFGTVADHDTNNSAIINSIIATSDLRNTLTAPGKQAGANIHIEGGVRFASESLSFLPDGDWVFVNLFYFANSDTTKGIPDGGGGTNEFVKLRVNSGYPGDPTGAMVIEENTYGLAQPAHTLNIAEQISGADAHLAPTQTRIPTALIPVRASYNIKHRNVQRYRTIYQCYGNNDESNGIWNQPFNLNIDLNNVGSTGWPTIPANGTVITGVTSGAKGVKSNHNATDCFVNFRSGQFIPGEKITNGVTTSTNNILSVTNTETAYPSLIFGFDNPVMTYAVPPGFSITGVDLGARLTSRRSLGSLVGGQHKEIVTNAAHVFTNTGAAIPTDGVQIVLDDSKRLVTVDGVANGTGSTGRGFVQGVAAWGNLTNAGGVSTNAGNIASITPGVTGTWGVAFTNQLANDDFSPMVMGSDPDDHFTVSGLTTAGFQINCTHAGVLAAMSGTAYFTVNGGI